MERLADWADKFVGDPGLAIIPQLYYNVVRNNTPRQVRLCLLLLLVVVCLESDETTYTIMYFHLCMSTTDATLERRCSLATKSSYYTRAGKAVMFNLSL